MARTSSWQTTATEHKGSQASGNTAGSTGLLPFPTRSSGKTQILSVRPASCRARLRSHSGHNAGAALAHAPTSPEYVIPPHLFRTMLLERLQLPLQIDETRCSGCQSPLDPLGRHRAACPRTGRTCSGQSMPRSRCESQDQRILAGHEHRGSEPMMGGALRFSPKICLASGEPNLRWMSRSDVPWRAPANLTRVLPMRMGQCWLRHATTAQRRWTRMLSTACSLSFAASLEPSDSCTTWCRTGGEAPPLDPR